jgi:hypothetical protein
VENLTFLITNYINGSPPQPSQKKKCCWKKEHSGDFSSSGLNRKEMMLSHRLPIRYHILTGLEGHSHKSASELEMTSHVIKWCHTAGYLTFTIDPTCICKFLCFHSTEAEVSLLGYGTVLIGHWCPIISRQQSDP